MSKQRKRGQRRARRFTELPPGAQVPRGEHYMFASGEWTRDRQYVLQLYKLAEQGIIERSRLPMIVLPPEPGLIPMSVTMYHGQPRPMYFNPEL